MTSTAPLRDRPRGGQGAAYLGLFFDLVFVFAVAQLSHLLLRHILPAGAARTLSFMLWSGAAWPEPTSERFRPSRSYTNPSDATGHRYTERLGMDLNLDPEHAQQL